MAVTADVPRLLSHPRRREIACAALNAPLTIGEIADRLETKDGAIRTTVDNLARDGLLVRSERPSRRGPGTVRQYQVDAIHRSAVRERCRDLRGAALVNGGELLLIPLANLEGAAQVLAGARPSVVAWAVRTRDPQLALMLGLREDSPPHERDALLLRLRNSGVECARLHVGEVFVPGALFDYARQVASTALHALPPGH